MRTQIGFKVTDNKLMVIEESTNETISLEDHQKIEHLLIIAKEIATRMEKQAASIARNRLFFDMSGKDLPEQLNKIYTKFYEPI